MTLGKPLTPPRTFTAADAHALADHLERNQRPQSDQAIAVKLIRALLVGRAAGDRHRTAGRVRLASAASFPRRRAIG
jgi:hypothetical protein